ncbi:DEAD/DEAH box helicase family protein [Aneurinibacillus sp. REN35]|uniref:DEAD/DEAH box helicase family protein n=1 Tax=Aneurinibacillus sp. REN35 TaxID=3237286 RepID=UPI003528E115
MNEIRLLTSQVIQQIIQEMQQASSIYILTSFTMKSGIELLRPHLIEAKRRGAEIKLLTGDYLYVTQPEALAILADLNGSVEARLWQSGGLSFHPKAYLFGQNDGRAAVIVGSSNLSRSALTYGVEWNVLVHSEASHSAYEEASEEYMKLFFHEHTIPINPETATQYESAYQEYHRKYPNLAGTWTEKEALDVMFTPELPPEPGKVIETAETYITGQTLAPREAQVKALEELYNRQEEGYRKAMVVMATGLGKTYLAGFFAQSFQRILFIAHREEILLQAMKSWKRVMPQRTHGMYNGKIKEESAGCVYASIYTLSRQQHLAKFQPKDFDLIVVDEFHHAAAASYRRVIEYFQPSFLLGITATPDRLDGKDVFALCDGNVAYQIHFIEAIQRGWLAPFHYYGVYDETDYSAIRWLGNRYDEEQLLSAQLREGMAESILKSYMQHRQTRALGFCSSIAQATFLAKYFVQHGVKAASLHSRSTDISRAEAIRRIEAGELEIILTVDLFNEGVDIPSLDTLLFVRPTESLAIFTQQVGRGLRLHPGKEKCVIIDFIGNYRNADVKLQLFDKDRHEKKKKAVSIIAPANCEVNVDLRVIDLLKELARKRQPRKERMLEAFLLAKQEMGRRPTYVEAHLQSGGDGAVYRQEFGSYLGFLYWAHELTDEEAQLFLKYKEWFVEVEKTVMNKSYKMVLLLAMLQRGAQEWERPIQLKEAARFFYDYLTAEPYRYRIETRDGKEGSSQKVLGDYHEKEIIKLLKNQPVAKWSGSSKGFACTEDDAFFIRLELLPAEREQVFEWTKEICEFRLHYYFEMKYV